MLRTFADIVHIQCTSCLDYEEESFSPASKFTEREGGCVMGLVMSEEAMIWR